MLLPRVIPCLLLRNRGFVKTQKFKNPSYVGDPLNILRIFNEKEVDEIIILDIFATPENRGPRINELNEIAGECFMPLGYGGGLRDIKNIESVLSAGFEKVCLNTAFVSNPDLVQEAAKIFGSQSIIVSIDVKKSLFGKYEVYTHCGTKKAGFSPEVLAKKAENMGAGEIILNSIDRDGMMSGYDLELIKRVASDLSIPVVACGGAGHLEHLVEGVQIGGASAVAAGSYFIYQGPHRAVLINAPDYKKRKIAFKGVELSSDSCSNSPGS